MATSYPRRDSASGIWKISDITSNIKTEGTFPGTHGYLIKDSIVRLFTDSFRQNLCRIIDS